MVGRFVVVIGRIVVDFVCANCVLGFRFGFFVVVCGCPAEIKHVFNKNIGVPRRNVILTFPLFTFGLTRPVADISVTIPM